MEKSLCGPELWVTTEQESVVTGLQHSAHYSVMDLTRNIYSIYIYISIYIYKCITFLLYSLIISSHVPP